LRPSCSWLSCSVLLLKVHAAVHQVALPRAEAGAFAREMAHERGDFLRAALAADRLGGPDVLLGFVAVALGAPDRPWPDAVGGNVVRPELARDAAREADDAELHHRLGGAAAKIGRDA